MKTLWFGLAVAILALSACTSAKAGKSAGAAPTSTNGAKVQVSTPIKMDTARPPFNTTPPPRTPGEPREMPAPGIPPKVFKTPLPFPQPTDKDLMKDKAYLTHFEVKPISGGRLLLTIQGNLPSPCHQLRVSASRKDGEIRILVYSVTNPRMKCVQKLTPFSAQVKIGAYPDGEYKVTVNGKEVGKVQIKHK